MNAIKLILIIGAVLGMVVVAATPAMGATITWDGSQDTDWHTPANWDLNRVPDADDDVVIPGSATVVISTDDAVCKTIDMGSGSLLKITGKALTLGDSSANTTSNLDTGKPGPAIIRFVKSGDDPGVLKVHKTVTFTGSGTIDAPTVSDLGRIERASGTTGIVVGTDIGVVGNITLLCDVTNNSTNVFGTSNTGQTMVFGQSSAGVDVQISGSGEFLADLGKIQFTIVSFASSAPKWIIRDGEIEVTDDAGPTFWDDLPFDVALISKESLLDLQHDFTCNGKLTVTITFGGAIHTITVASGKIARF